MVFREDDDALRGDLYRPEGAARPPIVVMAHPLFLTIATRP